MAVATWQDVATELGRPSSEFTTEEKAQITWWLDGAELRIKSRLGPVGDLDLDAVKRVEAEVVAGKVERAKESSVTVAVDGGGSVTRRYDNRVTLADFTDDMWALFGSTYTGTAYTIPVSSPLDIA